MQLNVSLYQDGKKLALGHEEVISFDDADKIGVQVGRIVRNWLRERPFRQSGTRTQFAVHAWWTLNGPAAPAAVADEVGEQRPKRRRRKKS